MKPGEEKTTILVYGYSSESNYGGVSLILGFRELLRQIDPTAKMVCVEDGPVPVFAAKEHDFTSLSFPYRRLGAFWKDCLRVRFLGRLPKDDEKKVWWQWFRAADTVVNLDGIAFCSSLKRAKRRWSVLAALKCLAKDYALSVAAKLFGKRSVKSTASFGPIESRADRLVAGWSSRFLFDAIVAREPESAEELRAKTGARRAVPVAPDIANLMPVPDCSTEPDLVGIVTSFQMEKQWKGPEAGYLETMVRLAEAILAAGYRIVLIPNQDQGRGSRPVKRSDTEIAETILGRLSDRSRVTVSPVRGRSGLARKAEIARCFLLVSPRYHACVSAMTCAVPTLTLGWHVKYRELARRYGQEEWLLPSEACTHEALMKMIRQMASSREAIAASIRAHQQDIVQAVVESGCHLLKTEAVNER